MHNHLFTRLCFAVVLNVFPILCWISEDLVGVSWQFVEERMLAGRRRLTHRIHRHIRSATATSSSMSTRAPASDMVNAPVVHHSNAFWIDPAAHREQVPRLAVLLLNAKHCSWHVKRQITPHTRNHATELFWNCWSNAHVTVCADGGANRLYDRSVQVEAEGLVQPQYIKGDLDSLRDDVRAFYEAKGTKIIHDPDQDSNDLDKCLQLVHDLQEEGGGEEPRSKFTVLIFGAMGGRFDQEMQNVNALFRWSDRFERITLLSEDTTTTLLQPGKRHVLTPNFHFETRTCGLIPIGAACERLTTEGLKWDMHEQRTEFGGLVSSSNHIEGDSVDVWNSHAVVWTTELKK